MHACVHAVSGKRGVSLEYGLLHVCYTRPASLAYMDMAKQRYMLTALKHCLGPKCSSVSATRAMDATSKL